MANEDDKLKLLRDILLIDDREIAQAINSRIELITETIERKEKLSEKIDPILDEKLREFVKEIPATLGPTITQTLKDQIANSKDEVVEALYPIMGQMIKRYIQNEMKILSENMNKKVNEAFSFKSLKRKAKAKVSGVKESDLIMTELGAARIDEVFVIEKGSGIMLGNYSKTATLDKDMISGMLTAIKSFVEDAFEGGNQNLESIEYELFKIHIQNFHKYYIAVVVSGTYNTDFANSLEDKLLILSARLSKLKKGMELDEVNKELKNFFESNKI